MQHIQDKELDDLFRSKFEDAKLIPSQASWQNIQSAIQVKKKKSFPLIYWSAAASVCLVITFSLLYRKSDKIQLSRNESLAVVQPVKPSTGREEIAVLNNKVATTTPTKLVASAISSQSEIISITEVVSNTEASTFISKVIENTSVNEEVIASIPNEQPGWTQVDNTHQAVFASESNEEIIADADTQKKIRNVGDLINFVVDKVDKRDNKALKFKTEDDESLLVGINIGFLKFNKRK